MLPFMPKDDNHKTKRLPIVELTQKEKDTFFLHKQRRLEKVFSPSSPFRSVVTIWCTHPEARRVISDGPVRGPDPSVRPAAGPGQAVAPAQGAVDRDEAKVGLAFCFPEEKYCQCKGVFLIPGFLHTTSFSTREGEAAAASWGRGRRSRYSTKNYLNVVLKNARYSCRV